MENRTTTSKHASCFSCFEIGGASSMFWEINILNLCLENINGVLIISLAVLKLLYKLQVSLPITSWIRFLVLSLMLFPSIPSLFLKWFISNYKCCHITKEVINAGLRAADMLLPIFILRISIPFQCLIDFAVKSPCFVVKALASYSVVKLLLQVLLPVL